MNPRIAKEFRALRLPWAAAAVAGALLPLLLLLNEGAGLWHGDVLTLLAACAEFILCASIPLLAAMSFGTEYQQRTLPFLLAQPMERSRLWMEKMTSLVAAIASVFLICSASVVVTLAVGWAPAILNEPDLLKAWLLIGVVILTTICSTGFWTLVARSTIGGLVFTASAQFITIISIGFALQRIYGDIPTLDSIVTCALLAVGLAYSALFLWLGRRKFAALELREYSSGEGFVSTTAPSVLSWRPALLRCRPNGSVLNLARKELRLQKTVFVIAGVLFLCWAVALALSFAAPIRKDYREGIFGGITAIYAFLLPVLAATISLGEERTLGLTAWHLTLPIAARVQWLMKLLVSAVVALGLGLVLPAVLLHLTAAAGKIDRLGFGANSVEVPAVGLAIGLPFLLGFWAVTFLGNTVKAVVAAVIGVGVLGSLCGLGVWCAMHLGSAAMLPISALIAWLQLPIYDFNAERWFGAFAWASVALVATAMLAQSLVQFRRAQSHPWTMAKHAAVLATLVLGCSCLTAVIVGGIQAMFQGANAELAAALNRLPFQQSDFAVQNKRAIKILDLDRDDSLSWVTKTWLRNASITVSLSDADPFNERTYIAQILLPKRGGFTVASEAFSNRMHPQSNQNQTENK